MVRKIVAASVLSLGLTVGMAGVASAQDSPGPSVLPRVIERQPLPQTGSDFGADVIVGLSLTAAGLAFAATARQRRRRLEATATAPTTGS
jgi:LPXTG-motif cell wall-anchored protein